MRPLCHCVALLVLVGSACKQREASAPRKEAAPAAAAPLEAGAGVLPGAVSASARRVSVKVSNMGYTPARVLGKAGEELVLVFQYDHSAGECGREVVLPKAGGEARFRLEEDKPLEVALHLPKKGELAITCGMNMLRGAVVVE